MPKFARRSTKESGRGTDKFYQEWHILREQSIVDGDQEWVIDVPRPLVGPPAGKYWAIEIQSIEHEVHGTFVVGAAPYLLAEYASLGTHSRVGEASIISHVNDPDNIWFWNRVIHVGTAADTTTSVLGQEWRRLDKSDYTDGKGNGKLVIGEHLYLQCSTAGHEAGEYLIMRFSIEYKWTTVSCKEFVEELTSQLQES